MFFRRLYQSPKIQKQVLPCYFDKMMGIVEKLVGAPPRAKQEDLVEVNRDLSIKTLFPQEFGIVDLDLLETVGTGTFGRIRLVKSISDKKFYALKLMCCIVCTYFHIFLHFVICFVFFKKSYIIMYLT